jgi:hypothetical protein
MNLEYESGDQVGALDEKKNRSKKSRASVPLTKKHGKQI